MLFQFLAFLWIRKLAIALSGLQHYIRDAIIPHKQNHQFIFKELERTFSTLCIHMGQKSLTYSD
jgi:hypothetical protein